MLVLTRKAGETIRIGPDIYVTVVKVGTSGIRLGIEAPAESSIVRGELLGRIDGVSPERLKLMLPNQEGES